MPFKLRDLFRLLANWPTSLARMDDIQQATIEEGVSPSRLARVLSKGTQHDYIGVWEAPDLGPHVFMTPRAASYLGVEMIEDVNNEDNTLWIWPNPDKKKKIRRFECVKVRKPKKGYISQSESEIYFSGAEAPPEPEFTERFVYEVDNPPYTRLKLGLGITWPIPGMDTVVPQRAGHYATSPLLPAPDICPGCHDEKLPLHGYCTVCCRSGFDWTIGLWWARQAKMQGRRQYRPGRLKGGVGA